MYFLLACIVCLNVCINACLSLTCDAFDGIQDAQKLAGSWGIPYVECSSKSGENVPEVFHTLLKEIEKDDGLLAEAGEGGCLIL
jgi:hypothetical protein